MVPFAHTVHASASGLRWQRSRLVVIGYRLASVKIFVFSDNIDPTERSYHKLQMTFVLAYSSCAMPFSLRGWFIPFLRNGRNHLPKNKELYGYCRLSRT